MRLKRNNNPLPCIFDLHEHCIVLERLGKKKEEVDWGDKEWVRIYCGMCVKTIYAKSRIENIKDIRVVNTL